MILSIWKIESNNIKLDENSYKDILIYCTGYITIIYLKYKKIYSVNPLFLVFKKVNGYFEKNHGKKYLSLVPTN